MSDAGPSELVIHSGGGADLLAETAARLIAALPASVELPAGTGKTELLTAVACQLADAGARTLILTHTNAGVAAILDRLKRLGQPLPCTVSTITAFAFSLARAYPILAGMPVPQQLVMTDSTLYVRAATDVAAARHIKRVLAASYTHLLVDEYQDCSRDQHNFICTLCAAIPDTGVFGDRMQAIFGFRDPLITWCEVQERFPDHPVPQHPWRWQEHNPDLGAWLLTLRGQLTPGYSIDLSSGIPNGVKFKRITGPAQQIQALTSIANAAWPPDDTVLVLAGKVGPQTRGTASRLQGRFFTMEEVAGTFMRTQLNSLAAAEPAQYALWLAQTAKKCFCGHGDLNKGVLEILAAGRTVAHLKRPGLEPTLAALDTVTAMPTLPTLCVAMDTLRSSPALRLHSEEAWREIQTAIRSAAAAGDDAKLTAELDKARQRIRHGGRRTRRRVVARTLLVKGLEFDHVVITDLSELDDQYNLYVALTRARKTIQLFGPSSIISIKATALAPP